MVDLCDKGETVFKMRHILWHIFMLVGKVDPMWGIHTAANLDVGKKEWSPVHK